MTADPNTPHDSMYASDAAEGAAIGLFALMTGLSEQHYCAGWLVGLEHSLWAATRQSAGAVRFGTGEITYAQIVLLRLLAEEAGGWWHWPSGSSGPSFVAMDKWHEIAARKDLT